MTALDIKILGPGCRNCRDLEQATREALATLGLDATVEKVTDIAAIAGYGVMAPPGLVVDGRVVSAGRVPDPARIAELLAGAPQP